MKSYKLGDGGARVNWLRRKENELTSWDEDFHPSIHRIAP